MIKQPTNQHELVLWYLLTHHKFSLKDVINEFMFFKFQTRLSELESKFGILAKREPQRFTNRFGYTGNYNLYSAIDKKALVKIYENYKNDPYRKSS